MENRFLDMNSYLKEVCRTGPARMPSGSAGTAGRPSLAQAASRPWSRAFAAADRVLVILIENGGVDLGIPALVDRLLGLMPGSSLIPDSARNALISGISDKLHSVTD